jgi:hypothetical protein
MQGKAKSGGRGLNIKTETLLKYLARDSKSDKIKLRCCELLLMLEGRLSQPEQKNPPKPLESPALASLITVQATDSNGLDNYQTLPQCVRKEIEFLAAES